MNKIPFHRPLVLQQDERERIIKKIDDCIITGMLTNNKNVRELEETIADLHDVKHAIAVSSASQGLSIALNCMNNLFSLPNFIYTPAFAWYSTKYAINLQSFNSIYCDIALDTWNMEKIPHNPLLNIPVHTFGNVTEVESDYKLYDGAHALGSTIKDFGDATVISLAPTKVITSIEGGVILTDNDKLAKSITYVRDKVSRMSEIHAIFGNAYLCHLLEVLQFKHDVFRYYRHHLHCKGIFQETDKSTNYNTIGMITDLKIPDCIETRRYYEPLKLGLKNTDKIYEKMVCLPSYYGCPYKEIIKLIKDYNES